jgi:hypothetical protein
MEKEIRKNLENEIAIGLNNVIKGMNPAAFEKMEKHIHQAAKSLAKRFLKIKVRMMAEHANAISQLPEKVKNNSKEIAKGKVVVKKVQTNSSVKKTLVTPAKKAVSRKSKVATPDKKVAVAPSSNLAAKKSSRKTSVKKTVAAKSRK